MALHKRLHHLRERMTAADSAWYRMSTRKSPADILAMMCLDGEVDRTRLEARIGERLRAHARFRQRITPSLLNLTPARWEDESGADAASHFEVRRLAAPGGEAELVALANELINEPFASNASPWRIYLIEGFHAGTVVFARLQHCMGDGFALVRVVLSLADEQNVLDARPTWIPSTQGLATKQVRDWLRRAPHLFDSLLRLLLLSFDPPSRFRGRLCGRRHLAWSRPIDLGRVRALAHARRVTINDMLTAVVAGAFRAYLDEHLDPVRPFRAIVPLNLRPNTTEPETDGNWFGLVYVDLPISEPDREQRVGAVKAAIDRIKSSEEALISLGVMDMMGWMPPWIERLFQALFARKGTVVVSNVVGPLQAFHVLGHPVRDLMFWPPHPGELACGLGIMSYAGRLRIGVRSDLEVVYDPERITTLFEQELQAFERDTSETEVGAAVCAEERRAGSEVRAGAPQPR